MRQYQLKKMYLQQEALPAGLEEFDRATDPPCTHPRPAGTEGHGSDRSPKGREDGNTALLMEILVLFR